MLSPSATHCSMAGVPSTVPGIFTITFGTSSFSQRRWASAIVPLVSWARVGVTSIEQ